MNTHQATRYIVPLREGGSLPAIVDTESGGHFVIKFRGAGQGSKALIAELLVAGIARALDLPVPEVALIELNDAFGRSEPDPEIQDILRGSRGLNFGMRYLEGAFNFDPATDEVPPDLAADIVWLDALVTNVDRTAKNPNLMWFAESLWLIDHGASFYFHHNWPGVTEKTARGPFPQVRDHVLLGLASDLRAADERLSRRLTRDLWNDVVEELPDALLMDAPDGVSPPFPSGRENRDGYRKYLEQRLATPRPFVETAVLAQEERRASRGSRASYRR